MDNSKQLHLYIEFWYVVTHNIFIYWLLHHYYVIKVFPFIIWLSHL